MRFAIFTHVPHFNLDGYYYAYTPFIREMNIWLEFADQVEIVAPLSSGKKATDTLYKHDYLKFSAISSINFLTFSATLISLLKIPFIFFRIISAMRQADHIHLRCPGNIGLLACVAQVFYPNKKKTAKYAGNWDPKSKQPWTYRLQKWILKNSFLTRNIQVLIYGNWPVSGPNILPFFTASFSEKDKVLNYKFFESPFKFIFVGNLVKGKGTFLCLEIIQKLIEMGYAVQLAIYGDGPLKLELERRIEEYDLSKKVALRGNQPIEILQEAYKKSDFCLLPSTSEGWPKALAEAMFYGCIPVATPVSCIPWMLDYENRGILIENSAEAASNKIATFLKRPNLLANISHRAQNWSQKYTLEEFREEIKWLI